MREIRDARGVVWQAWAVRPSWSATEGRADGTNERRPRLAPHLTTGWLAFLSAAGERRRIVPVPSDWDVLDDDGLARLLAVATPLEQPHRRLVE